MNDIDFALERAIGEACVPAVVEGVALDAIAERQQFRERPVSWDSNRDERLWTHPYMARTNIIVHDEGYCRIGVRGGNQAPLQQLVLDLLAREGLMFQEVGTAENYRGRIFARYCGVEGTPFFLTIEANGDPEDMRESFSATLQSMTPAPPPFCSE